MATYPPKRKLRRIYNTQNIKTDGRLSSDPSTGRLVYNAADMSKIRIPTKVSNYIGSNSSAPNTNRIKLPIRPSGSLAKQGTDKITLPTSGSITKSNLYDAPKEPHNKPERNTNILNSLATYGSNIANSLKKTTSTSGTGEYLTCEFEKD